MELQLSATWILEVVACIVSMLALGGMAAVLGYADGKVVIAWHGLTLNTIISILGTTSKLCAMFVLGAAIAQSKWALFSRSPRSLLEFETVEQAGRGAFGAAKLLVTSRRVATVGAIAILLSLAFDPFSQQIVQFRQELQWKQSPAASLPRAQRYSAGNRVPKWGGYLMNLTRGGGADDVHVNADFTMQSSILYGLTRPQRNVTQQLSLNCPSGNCTWPTSETLAVCSVCHDLSSTLQLSKNETSPLQIYLDGAGGPVMIQNVTRYELANGLYIDNADDEAPGTRMTTFGTGNPAKTASMREIDTLIWSMSMIRVANQDAEKNWPSAAPLANECALYYCVKQYNTTVTNGTINQMSTIRADATRSKTSWQVLDLSPYPDTTLTSSDRESLEFDSEQSAIQRTDLTLGENYNISQSSIDSISQYFQTMLSKTNITGAFGQFNTSTLNGFVLGAIGNPTTQYAPDSVSVLHNSTDLDATFAAVAESMSNVIRANGDNKLRTTGQIGIPVTKFQISWPWIALPALVVLFAMLQLIITMWTSRHIPLWKSSTLATLSRGPYVGEVLNEASTVQEMTTAASSQQVHLFSHTAPGGVAAIANTRAMTKVDPTHISIVEMGR
ncbi:hypothetical protein HII31_08179 [Pseudocercospora fuligena]|uniref:Uncharacterized protein n=1 Tax=Pseudocercospora fuligena TaxID=685502 RepID=A0A8H6VGD9_9PEZI|nr:hypothetical protein HII31_08179 [Pseudocercospora fuligena]